MPYRQSVALNRGDGSGRRRGGRRTDGALHRRRPHGLIVPVPSPDWALDSFSDHYRFENALLHLVVQAEQSPAQAMISASRVAKWR
ncbi:hypothetical protein SFUMM280S_07476 [Streptomyces fumanus]